ncbi:MAG: serine--tRNA ligase [Chlamydiae bacterium RIFCSPHIGHO2_12_FULL_44_59]|nr:MAG: serine--tRNA ligase [Chlamydiae bacterium RIFCSPHIGHO2_01_FULL_44_39]OGN59155.1 MAG: serine--tRNA ligase [Chlamydiae bacterium RIFCSPHIGHO2_02_FULL_45_9]OGN59811.1 MAG: serine--tRNA ligase [Chlamydiae bacterium RIFCSPHIGHO2_12_FULL_44_59]OGN65909.1 MAG: serine--tRNA ligase [Chlamydiae bacterium RIFCSPLOWO2_01_FULL_44_52]OGN68319.1 MAG: serine--tRNA ligase [Chlamydiae bacterium RIFCSPLOWO2_02_FULL_45_22]OGN69628.1 MAG: serine--tRNA ligase [Chlamydiae bacterium RIFCSPLOWO2_12_FULL_45_20]
MLDLKELRKDPVQAEQKLKNKLPEASLPPILALDEKLRAQKTEVDELKAKRNLTSKLIGQLKQKGQDPSSVMQEMGDIGDRIVLLDQEIVALEKKLSDLLATLPNLPMDDVPVSPNAADNVCIKEWGKKPLFSFPLKHHVELNERLHLFDFQRAAKLSGAGWPLYVGLGARLEWALLNYMLHTHRKKGFTQVIPPLLVKPEVMYGSGQLPKFERQLYKITDEDYDLYLIPTSEVSINGMHIDEILEEEDLSLRYTAYTPCFRREAGAAGSQERGLIRMHQFNKVEMFCLTKPEESPKVFEEMLLSAEEILQGLGLHYRNMLLTTGDMSFAAAKTVDIEVWLPGQNRYMEVSSVSNCTDFQARRSQIRYRKKGEKLGFVHTLNGSGLATSRLMVALLENNQQEDGSILVPNVLHKYLEEEIECIKPG